MRLLVSLIAVYVPLYSSVTTSTEELKTIRFPDDSKMTDPNDLAGNHKETNSPLPYRQNPHYYNHPPAHYHPPYYHNHPPYYHNHPPYDHQYHPRFDHNPDLHRENRQNSKSEEDSDSVSFSSSNEESCCSHEDGMSRNRSLGIPIDFIQTINKYSVNDLLLTNFIEGAVDDDKEMFLTSRFGDQERSAASIPKAAGCSPEMKTIQLKTSDDPTVLYIPQCTKIPQCGGCCSHSLLSCQPNQTETLAYQVLKTQYNGNKKLRLLGKEVVAVEKHITCHCGCKIKEEVARANCNAYQEYRANECRCVCTNNDEEKKCYKNYNKKLWDPELCACQCRDILQCSSGYSFDQHECKCVPTPLRRRFAVSTDSPFLEDDE